ncbi:fibronectin type III domain-containing protein [Micromonospora carbonacea]|uniref:Fibronectin type III domain-containing protein n=1 Tax=Micromonospora carbonacea TaxID=47853 RepID=A0A7H8XN20_9ACTN|nr:fibronectin type III domain-containing protein [Micromonospora carbonacea]MBB5825556.1 putative RNA-binding protein with TRAM domain [Micromonospora carbonacea]QLD26406.1 fibronectin type III domain-containing protein [Micromonospora carbonacea]
MATIDDAVSTGPGAARRRRWRGGLVTVGTVSALLAAMGLTVLGLGAADNAVANYDASSWLWSAARSELARVNGVTARVDTRVEVPDARRHPVQVVQTDRLLILRDLNTGQVSSLDLATLQITASTRTTPGLGVNVALHSDAAFVVDAVQGVVRQLDPRSLAPVGEPVRYPPGITGGAFDGEGRLWVAVPAEGTVSAVTAAELPSEPGPAAPPGGGISPKRVETYEVAEPSHELMVSTLDDGVAVLDRTAGTLVRVQRGEVVRTPLTIAGPGALPARTSGPKVPVTVAGERKVHVIGAGGEERQFTVPGRGDELSPAVAWADRFYCADESTGTVYSFDASGQLVDTIGGKGSTGPLELEVRENRLFINAPDSSTARVVDDKHRVREVNKYANDVLGGDPPPVPPPPPPPKKPKVGKPSAPRSVTASAGNARARVSWRPAAANGAEIIRYVVEGAGERREVGANQRSVEVTGLTNGETYRFSVHAVNAKGDGPARSSNPVTPTAAVPDPPSGVTAEARPDGTVLVKWPAANGQGNTIAKYAVTATSAGANAPAGESTKTELVVPAGELDYGTQYAFTVVSVNDRGAGSAASPVSNSVVPFAAPGAPVDLRATTVANRPGTVAVQWSPAAANGRPVTKYLVAAGGRSSEVTDTRATVDGLGDGQSVTVTVQAVNEAGPGETATGTARTVAPPRVTVTGSSATATAVTVNFTVDAGGGQATCTVSVPGEKPVTAGNCASATVPGLTPGTAYTATVTASNAAGEGTARRAQSTDPLYGVATCNNGPDGDQRTYCNKDVDGRNGNEIFSVPRQDNDKQVGWARPGTRLKAYCKRQGESVDSWIYNDQKQSSWWVRVEFEGKNYIPWAWLNLEGGDNINVLPTC